MKQQIGEAIIRLRERRGWDQKRLAKLADIPQPTLSRAETGQRMPATETLLAIARGLGVTPNEIFNEAGVIFPDDELSLRALYDIARILTPEERQPKRTRAEIVAASQLTKQYNTRQEICLFCGETFWADGTQGGQLYCDAACRQAAYRERKRQKV